MEGSRAPYNSIYETVSVCTAGCEEPLICCTHGVSCDFTPPLNEEAVKNNTNLAVSSPERERNNLIDRMKKDLQVSDFFTRKRAKKNKRQTPKKSAGKKEQKQASSYQVPNEEIFPQKDKSSGKGRNKNWATAKDSLETTAALAQKNISRFRDAYLGACTYPCAELTISKEIDFRLYHRMPTVDEMDDIEDQALLYLVCKNGNHFRHYPVKIRTKGEEGVLCYVDYGDPRSHVYTSLDDLVTAFAQKVHLFEGEYPFPLVEKK